MDSSPGIAILLPCFNEEQTIAKVIDDFRAQLPGATIYVFDNRSTDATAEVARSAGATVLKEPRQGKGFVIESMFDRISAGYYVMADGDDTYPASCVNELLEPVMNGEADMVVGARLANFEDQAFRPLHVAGNSLVRGLINRLFGSQLTDIMSGYRAFNRKLAQRIPIVSEGFDVETELTIRTLYYRLVILERQVPYGVRPEGSHSKLNTFRDGFRVLWRLFSLFRSFKPLTFFGALALVVFLLGCAAGFLPIHDYFTTGLVPHFPLAILAASLMLLSFILGAIGIILHAVNWRFMELHSILTRGMGQTRIDTPQSARRDDAR